MSAPAAAADAPPRPAARGSTTSESARSSSAGISAPVRLRALAGWAALSLPAIALILLRIPSLFEPRWYGDEGVFAAVAYHIVHGQTLYVGAWDNKPPLIFLTYAAVQLAFGTGMFALHAVATAAALATLAVLMVLAARMYGRSRAIVAGGVLAILLGLPMIEANLALSEIFMILPASAAMLVALAAMGRPQPAQIKWYLVAGILLGIAANYKQVAVFDTAALALVVWRAPGRPVLSVGTLAAGFALPHLVALVAFSATGALGGYWYAVVGSLSAYASGPGQASIGTRVLGGLPVLIAVVSVLLAKDRTRVAGMLPAAWLGFAFAGALSSTFAFPHYLIQAAPPFALVVAGMRLPKRTMMLSTVAPAVVGLAAVVLGANVYASVIRERKQTHPLWYYDGFVSRVRGNLTTTQYDDRFDGSTITVPDIVAAIRADGGGRSLFAWANLPWIYAEGGYANPSRYSTAWLGTWVPGARSEIIADVSAHPPDYLVISDNVRPFPQLQGIANRLYTPIRRQGDWWLYRRRA